MRYLVITNISHTMRKKLFWTAWSLYVHIYNLLLWLAIIQSWISASFIPDRVWLARLMENGPVPHSIRTSSSRMGERLQTLYIVWRMEHLDTRSQELFAQYRTIAAKLKSKSLCP